MNTVTKFWARSNVSAPQDSPVQVDAPFGETPAEASASLAGRSVISRANRSPEGIFAGYQLATDGRGLSDGPRPADERMRAQASASYRFSLDPDGPAALKLRILALGLYAAGAGGGVVSATLPSSYTPRVSVMLVEMLASDGFTLMFSKSIARFDQGEPTDADFSTSFEFVAQRGTDYVLEVSASVDLTQYAFLFDAANGYVEGRVTMLGPA